jgi:hypothetical protein
LKSTGEQEEYQQLMQEMHRRLAISTSIRELTKSVFRVLFLVSTLIILGRTSILLSVSTIGEKINGRALKMRLQGSRD